jgi:hypothetical protein
MAEGLVPSLHRKGFNTLVILVAWWIWKHRNACVFYGVSPNCNRSRRMPGFGRWQVLRL